MLSVITAVHNQLEMNKLFYQNLVKYSVYPIDLIVIDNNSTDGTREFFKSCANTRVIENDANYSYPYTQNQGTAIAKHKIYAYLNNDIIVAPKWDERIVAALKANNLDVLTTCGVEKIETPAASLSIWRKWNAIKNIFKPLGYNGLTLRLMHKLMYGNWERFTEKRWAKFGTQVMEGCVGNSVILTQRAIDFIGPWDVQIQEADFDLTLRAKKRKLEYGDIQACHFALGVFHHHYIRVTTKSKPPQFIDRDKLISLEEKWPLADREKLLKGLH